MIIIMLKTLVVGRGNIKRTGYYEFANMLNPNLLTTTLDFQESAKPDICMDFLDYIKSSPKDKYDSIIFDISTIKNVHHLDTNFDKLYNLLNDNGTIYFPKEYIFMCDPECKEPKILLTHIMLPFKDFIQKNKYDIYNDIYFQYLMQLGESFNFDVDYFENKQYPLFTTLHNCDYYKFTKRLISQSHYLF
jgi:hypothetical protein